MTIVEESRRQYHVILIELSYLFQLLLEKKIPSIPKSSVTVNAYQNIHFQDLALGVRDPLCMIDEQFDDDCICWIKVAEGLTIDGILERWEKIKLVIMEAWNEEIWCWNVIIK